MAASKLKDDFFQKMHFKTEESRLFFLNKSLHLAYQLQNILPFVLN